MSTTYVLQILIDLKAFYDRLPAQPHSPELSLMSRQRAYALFNILVSRSLHEYITEDTQIPVQLLSAYEEVITSIHKTFQTIQEGPIHNRPLY
jgi:hypothetical protein